MSDYGSSCCETVSIFAEKDPDATEDYAFNWALWLEDDTIEDSEFILPDGLTEVSSSFTTKATTIMVSGGTACSIYRITNRITTLAGRIQDRTVYIRIKEK